MHHKFDYEIVLSDPS